MNRASEYETLLEGKLSTLNDILKLTESSIVDPDDMDGYVNYVNYIDDKERIFQNLLSFDEKIETLNVKSNEKNDASLQLEQDVKAVCIRINELDELNLKRANQLLDNMRGEICSVKKQKKVNTYGHYFNVSAGGSFDTTK